MYLNIVNRKLTFKNENENENEMRINEWSTSTAEEWSVSETEWGKRCGAQ